MTPQHPMTGATTPWSLDQLPDQSGRTWLITGPSIGGIGFHTALEAARRGARVILAGRTPTKLEAAKDAILAQCPHAAAPEFLRLDLASLDAVRHAGAEAKQLGQLDILINNAGILPAGHTSLTVDGYEETLATNFFGPFLFTGLVLPQVTDRVVTVASMLHRMARRAPLHGIREPRNGMPAYNESKLADLSFGLELQRRLTRTGSPVLSMVAHPGFASTKLAVNGSGNISSGASSILDATIRAIAQPVSDGAWPTLMAATAPLPGGSFVGPRSMGRMRGAPVVQEPSRLARDPEVARALWAMAEEVTGIRYP